MVLQPFSMLWSVTNDNLFTVVSLVDYSFKIFQRALKLEVSPEFVNECVGTRLRAETADLPEYLFSRSVAGATHTDLISGIRKASGDLIVGRFFSVKDMSVSSFSRWIVQWICKGRFIASLLKSGSLVNYFNY